MADRKSFIIFIMLFVFGCSSVQKTALNETENTEAKKFLALVKDFNLHSPETVSSAFTADGNMGDKKFRVEGSVAFDKKGYYKVKVLDYVFKSPVLETYREQNRLYFYYGSEKKLLVDDADKIELSRYAGFNTDYKILYTLLTGGIPLIENFSVYKCLYDEKEKGYNLIVENVDYFENIFFRDDVPQKILFIHKSSRDKSEIYLKSIVRKDKTAFFKKYRIVVPAMNTSIDINFSKPQLNEVISVEKLNREKLPKNTEIIRIH